MPVPITRELRTGRPSRLESGFRRRVSAYVRNAATFKSGSTNNPWNRRSQPDHRGHRDRMIVMYRTRSWNSAKQPERLLIDHYRGSGENVDAGGGGPSDDPPRYLYVVIHSGS